MRIGRMNEVFIVDDDPRGARRRAKRRGLFFGYRIRRRRNLFVRGAGAHARLRPYRRSSARLLRHRCVAKARRAALPGADPGHFRDAATSRPRSTRSATAGWTSPKNRSTRLTSSCGYATPSTPGRPSIATTAFSPAIFPATIGSPSANATCWRWIARGASNKEAGRELDISPRTVEVHRARIMEKTRSEKRGRSHANRAVWRPPALISNATI